MATVNKTFRLHEDVVRLLDELVANGESRSRTALIEELIRREARRRDRDRRLRERAREYAEAWADPEYRAEQMRIAEEFWPLDVEAWLKADPVPPLSGWTVVSGVVGPRGAPGRPHPGPLPAPPRGYPAPGEGTKGHPPGGPGHPSKRPA